MAACTALVITGGRSDGYRRPAGPSELVISGLVDAHGVLALVMHATV